MIILDTNVISELMRPADVRSEIVLAWVRGLSEQPVTTVINRAEILAGTALLPPGRRRDHLQEVAAEILGQVNVSLPLVPEAADAYASIVAARRHAGQPIGALDALIGAIAVVSGSGIATRDIEGFTGIGLRLTNPWTGETTT